MQTEYIGIDALKNLPEILNKISPERIFLVTGKNSYTSSGAEEALAKHLEKYEVVRFSNFSSNIDIKDIEKGITLFKEHGADLVISIGGGSVMDMGKLVTILSVNDGNPEEFITGNKKVIVDGRPLIAIPTTSGSGSEATHFAVVYIDKQKYSLAHQYMLPNFSIIDPLFTYSLPAKISATTGIDALSQAIESYWSIHSTEESKGYAKKALTLVLKNLEKAVNTSDKSSKNNMSVSAHFAGKAINISKTTASHALSYPLTIHFGVPHGHAVGLTLSNLLIYNSKAIENDVVDTRGIRYLKETLNELYSIFGVSSSEEVQQIIDGLLINIGLSTKLSTLGIETKDIEVILNEFSEERAANNPRKFTRENAEDILNKII